VYFSNGANVIGGGIMKLSILFFTLIFGVSEAFSGDLSSCQLPEAGTYSGFVYSQNSNGSLPSERYYDFSDLEVECTAKVELKRNVLGSKYYLFSVEADGTSYSEKVSLSKFRHGGKNFSCDSHEADVEEKNWGRFSVNVDEFSLNPFNSKTRVLTGLQGGADYNLKGIKIGYNEGFYLPSWHSLTCVNLVRE